MQVAFIKHVVDAMVINKMNVLHLHITDDQSFPIESTLYPKLTVNGSFGPLYVYSHADIADIGSYAMQR